ncbi:MULTISPECIES: extracellular solute-binding protein [Streptomyces]|uniref:Extracellular solute-binding protein n=2 Tax=Streptomyces TaxID=1883 RepID=A0A3M8FE21_9ACTN|nr:MULTISPECIES: extracellular solute-binding protein [Streptomyces]KNE81814.1 ABC transporter substrate-binding protein [Streptomyces fradiae]OFA59141.1 ABC transporter substrate-binding protein [Streptomyces fradiae]PQM24861.1 ABC transporter substrate-binding protein [Streptomyces xinghaiensis]RKM98913.1 extracellular solute-binding protein [Streptomyces xinghaiensis]RNC76185.1 extracellular solute-binding protein [Streptomyces xinghaiensis]
MQQSSRTSPSRRSVLTGLGALAAAGTLGTVSTGCAAPSAAGADRTRLRFWHLFGGGDGVNMQTMLDAYRAEHPHIGLEAATLQWGAPYYTKLGMAGAGGRAPEVAALHLTRLPGFAPGRLLDPFDLGLLAEHGVRPQDFPEDIWRRGSVDGEQYAVPLDTHPLVLFYNLEICKKTGLLGDDGKLRPINGAREFTEALRAVKKTTGRPALAMETMGADTVGPWRLFAAFYSQTGGTVLDDTGTRITIDDAKALRVLEWMRSLVDEGLAIHRVDYQGGVGAFNTQRTAFLINGEWEVSTFLTTKIPFSMTRIPDVFGRASTFADCHTFVLPHQAGRGGASNEAAHAFVAWLLKHTVEWAKGGHVPAYLPTLEKPEYLELTPQSEYRSVLNDVALDPPAWFAGSASSMQIELGAVFSGVLTGSRSPRNGLAEAKRRLRKLLDTPNPFGGAA